MKVLFCGLKSEYGDPAKGLSFEYKHFYSVLEKMDGVTASDFPIDEIMRERGRDGMNELLIKTVQEQRPDLLFCFLFTEEIKKETIDFITRNTPTKTFNWFGDDHWRFYGYSRHWAPLFTLVSTTDRMAYELYRKAGLRNVLKTQWGANPFLYAPQDPARDTGKYHVTFYGQKYGNRGNYIDALVSAGLPATGIGRGWGGSNGSDVQEMLDIYSFSQINLNFTETPYYGFKKKLNLFAKLFLKKELGKYRLNLKSPIANFRSMLGTQRRTIKARTFEVTACGGFLLTGPSDDPLDEYLIPGKEAVIFRDSNDLVEKVRYYLQNEDERKKIALAGCERTRREHTYIQRFRQIFNVLELK